MPWFPPYDILAGVLAGASPAGSLENIVDYMGSNLNITANMAYGIRQYTQSQETDPLPKWNGAYGSNGDIVTDYIDDHDGANQVLLAEIPIKNPEGATYYRQTLCFKFDGSVTRYTSYGGTWDYFSYSPYSIERRVYADPQSPFQVTHTWPRPGNVGTITFAKNIQTTQPVNRYASIREYIAFGSFTKSNEDFFGIFMYGFGENYSNNRQTTEGSLLAVKKSVLDAAFGSFEPDVKDDPNEDPDNPPDEEGGGDGEHKRPVDPIPFPDMPSAGGMNAGFITLYKLAPAEMWLFSQSFFSDTLLEYIRDMFGNPMDIFVGLGIVPFIPEGNELWYPKIGNSVYVSNHPLTRISNQYYELDCGSISIEEFGKNALDYSPYTKILIWLPYIGYRQLPVDEVMGKNIHVKYFCDCLGGDCVAVISTQVMPKGLNPPVDVVIAQYNGNILTQVPVAGSSYDNLISNVVNSAIGGLGVMADAAAGGLDGSAVTKQINSLTSAVAGIVNGMKPVMKRDGSPGSSSGLLSVQKPYIIRHIPNQSLPSGYANVIGYPSNIGGTLGDGFSGLAIVEDIQLNNIPAMESEREEIKQLLREGVII